MNKSLLRPCPFCGKTTGCKCNSLKPKKGKGRPAIKDDRKMPREKFGKVRP